MSDVKQTPPTAETGTGIVNGPQQIAAGPAACPHLRKRARGDDGRVKVKLCEPCENKAVDLFNCDHPGTAPEVTLHDCETCQYRPGAVVPIDRVYLINLKKRPERLAAFRDRQERLGWGLPEVRVFAGLEGDLIGVPAHFRQGGGAWGCLRSHCAILERCLQDGVNSVMVVEDDVEWFSDCWERLKDFLPLVPADWSQLMLGGQHMTAGDQIAAGVIRCKNTQRTHSYVIRGAAIRSLLKAWYSASVHIDWVMGGDWQRGWPVYAPDPFIFGQAGGKSDISGRLNNSLYWNSPTNPTVIALDAPPAVAAALRSHGLHMGFRRNADGVDDGLQGLVSNGARTEDLQGYITTIAWEVASMRGRVATLWCPSLDLDLVARAHSGPVRIVRGQTVDECLSQCEGLGLERNFSTSHILVLRAPREAVEGLAGFHRGYWLDDATGQDRGQQEAARGETVKGLQRWAKHTFEEAERSALVPMVWHEGIGLGQVRDAFPDRQCVEVYASTSAAASKGFARQIRPKSLSGRVRQRATEPMVAREEG